jgi:hypothetical protein
MGFNRRKMEDQRRDAAEKEAASRRATDVQVLEDAERLTPVRNERRETASLNRGQMGPRTIPPLKLLVVIRWALYQGRFGENGDDEAWPVCSGHTLADR